VGKKDFNRTSKIGTVEGVRVKFLYPQFSPFFIQLQMKTTYKSFSQLHLSNLLIKNYSSVQFLLQTLSGNTLSVGTKSIPSVSSEAKNTGSGLLQSGVT
jgi:hypothetical protein